MSAAEVTLWPSLTFRDAEAMLGWLTTIGFTEHAVYRDDRGGVVHAEMTWSSGGGIMFGTHSDGEELLRAPGGTSIYLITEDPDAVQAAAVAAGGNELRQVSENDYGGRGGTVRDPEGNLWSFGTYRPV